MPLREMLPKVFTSGTARQAAWAAPTVLVRWHLTTMARIPASRASSARVVASAYRGI